MLPNRIAVLDEETIKQNQRLQNLSLSKLGNQSRRSGLRLFDAFVDTDAKSLGRQAAQGAPWSRFAPGLRSVPRSQSSLVQNPERSPSGTAALKTQLESGLNCVAPAVTS